MAVKHTAQRRDKNTSGRSQPAPALRRQNAPGDQARKRRRCKLGEAALREIRHLPTTCDRIIPAARTLHQSGTYVREITYSMSQKVTRFKADRSFGMSSRVRKGFELARRIRGVAHRW